MPDNLLIESTGLTSSDLSLATALPSDVMSGKSFYSGNDTLKYGTMTLSATATEADVASGKTFYAGSKEIKTGSYKNLIQKYTLEETQDIGRIFLTMLRQIILLFMPH